MMRTVLVVDDNAAIRAELRESLAGRGFHVCAEAANGREAIERARESLPKLIILDLSMPVMNGLEAAPQLRAIVPESGIILFTSFADTVSPSDLKTLGIDAVLSKNDVIDAVIATAEALCGSSSGGAARIAAAPG